MKENIRKFINDFAIHIAIIIFFLLFVITSYGYSKMRPVNEKIQGLEERITKVETQMKQSEGPTDQTEYLKTIEFLEKETTKYRGFIQEQQNYLIWLFGVAAAVFLTLMAFLGIESRKKISDIFQEQYAEMVNDKLNNFIGGEGQKEYLMGCIRKEREAKKKKILFLKQRESDQNLEKIYEFLKDHEYNVQQKKIKNSMKEDAIGKIIKGYNVVIYQVDKSECDMGQSKDVPKQSQCSANKETGEEKNYVKISNQCNDQKIYGIFYSVNRIDLTKCNSCFYVSTTNFGATLLDRINSILYFTQELSDE
nr:hypothetical protein [uncultured Schaedlerella sp.]